jgi:hypothetical protein
VSAHAGDGELMIVGERTAEAGGKHGRSVRGHGYGPGTGHEVAEKGSAGGELLPAPRNGAAYVIRLHRPERGEVRRSDPSRTDRDRRWSDRPQTLDDGLALEVVVLHVRHVRDVTTTKLSGRS